MHLSSVAVLVLVLAVHSTTAVPSCKTAFDYVLTIHTATMAYAGTDVNVKVSIVGPGNVTSPVLTLPTTKAMLETGSVDSFNIKLADVTTPLQLIVETDGSGSGAEWRVRRMELLHVNSGVVHVFVSHFRLMAEKNNVKVIRRMTLDKSYVQCA